MRVRGSYTQEKKVGGMMLAGYLHLDCEEVSPLCEISLTELLEEELTDDSKRARRSVFGLPPLITTAGEKPQCKLCEKKGTLCFLFGLGKACPSLWTTQLIFLEGSFKGCAGASLLEPYLGPLCNAAALPVRLACKANSIKCYKQGCGLIRIPNIKLPIPLP